MSGERRDRTRTTRRLRTVLLTSSALALAWALPATPSQAQDATWLASPGSNDYGTGTNWSTGAVPSGTAYFDTTNTSNLVVQSDTVTGGWTFNAGAPAYTVSNNSNLKFNGTGISVNGGSVAITNNAKLDFINASTAGSAVIDNPYTSTTSNVNFYDTSSAGTAVITNMGASQVNFFASSSADHAVITNYSTVFFQDSSSAGSATITSYVNLSFFGSSNAGNANITSSGGLAFFDSSTAGNATITINYVTLFFDNSTAGSAALINNYSSVDFSSTRGPNGDNKISAGSIAGAGSYNLGANELTVGSNGLSTEVGGVISGNGGSLVKVGTGTLTLSGANTYTNGTTINGGTLQLGSAGNSGFILGNVAVGSGATFDVVNADTSGITGISNSGTTYFRNNATASNAQLVNTASSAVVDFNTSGPSSDGRISAGSIAGDGRFNLNGAELTVGGNNLSTTVTGLLTGDGSMTGTSLIKVGAGTLTLSGINTYTGATSVDGGTLSVNGSIASSSSLTVNSGATLGGTGIVGNTTIASGGMLAPGNSIGTLTVSGNLTFSAGSFYTVEVATAGADRTNVSGTATLAGATVQAVAIPGSFRGQTFTLLNATGGLGGTQFAGLTITGSFSPARNPRLTYDLNNVYLVLDPGTIILPAGSSGNQTGVASGINNAVESGATPPAGFDTLLNMNGAQLNRALSEVSGQPGAASTQAAFNAMQQFLGMLDPVGGGMDSERSMSGGGAMGYAATTQDNTRVREAYAAVTPRDASGDVIDRRWGLWASAYGGASTLNGNTAADSSTTTSRIYGTVVGADYCVSPDTVIGFALGGAGYNFALSDSLGGGRADLFQAGLYGRHNFGPAYLSASLAYGWQDVTTDRTVTVSGTDRLTANFKASTFSGRLETGWRFAPIPTSTFGVTPYAAAQVTTFHLPGYGETAIVGSNQFALSYNSQDTTNVRTELGARTDQRFLVNDGELTLRGRLAWAHDSNTNRLVSAAFQTLPGAAFTVRGAQPAADSALLGGRAEMKWRNGLSLAGTVEGEFSQSTQTYTGKSTVRYEW